MADNDDLPGSPDRDATSPDETPTTATAASAAPPAEAPAPVLKTRWRDRAWTFRAMIAVALASLLVGGLAGGAVVAAAGGDDRGREHHRMGPWGPGGGMPGHRGRGPGGFNGGGPQWGWNDGQPSNPDVTPYGVPTPTPIPPTVPKSPSSPGSTG